MFDVTGFQQARCGCIGLYLFEHTQELGVLATFACTGGLYSLYPPPSPMSKTTAGGERWKWAVGSQF